MKALALVAHPDDEVLGVGGTLLKHKAAGDEVRIVIVHPCRPEGNSESYGAELRMDMWYERLWMNGHTIEDIVASFQPDIVYTHSAADLHHDHQDVHQRTLVACRPQSGVRAIYAFETPSATDWSGRPFIPQRFVDITPFVDGKSNAMRAYQSELREAPHPRNVNELLHRAHYWGQRVGVHYAEAFEVIRECA